jgi:hypothetical protein
VVSKSDTTEIKDSLNLLSTVAGTNDESEFTLFPKLELELRQKIWSAAAAEAEPRIIKISYSSVSGHIPFSKIEVGPLTVPPLLHTSCEAGGTVTTINKNYKACQESELQSKTIYINFGKDILYSDTTYVLGVLGGYQLPGCGPGRAGRESQSLPKDRTIFEKELRYLALRNWTFNDNVKLVLSRFQKLEEVILVHYWNGELWSYYETSFRPAWVASLKERWVLEAKERGVIIGRIRSIRTANFLRRNIARWAGYSL